MLERWGAPARAGLTTRKDFLRTGAAGRRSRPLGRAVEPRRPRGRGGTLKPTGLVADAANYVMASYNRATQTVAVAVANGGQLYKLIQASATLAAPVTFAFVINDNDVIAWLRRPRRLRNDRV